MKENYSWYGRRYGRKLSSRRKDLILKLLPKISFNISASKSSKANHLIFDREDIWLEIGFGGGEHLVGQALLHPGVGFIGCEPYVNGVASLLSKIEEK